MLFEVTVGNKFKDVTMDYIVYVESNKPIDAEGAYMSSEYKSYGDSVCSVEKVGEGNVVRVL